MFAIDHIRAYWLHLAMRIPGGAANPNEELRINYWAVIAQMNTARNLSQSWEHNS